LLLNVNELEQPEITFQPIFSLLICKLLLLFLQTPQLGDAKILSTFAFYQISFAFFEIFFLNFRKGFRGFPLPQCSKAAQR
jgi:hypothetical protein